MARVNEKDILKVIHDALNLKKKNITINTTINDVEKWDSLGHLGILAALDKFFDGKIASIKEMATADSVKKIIKILRNNSLM